MWILIYDVKNSKWGTAPVFAQFPQLNDNVNNKCTNKENKYKKFLRAAEIGTFPINFFLIFAHKTW